MSLIKYLLECIKKEAFESPFDTDVVYDVNESDCGCNHENNVNESDCGCNHKNEQNKN